MTLFLNQLLFFILKIANTYNNCEIIHFSSLHGLSLKLIISYSISSIMTGLWLQHAVMNLCPSESALNLLQHDCAVCR